MKLGEFLRDKSGRIICHVIAMMVLAVFLMLTGTSKGVVMIILIVWTVCLSITLTENWIRTNSYIKELEGIIDDLDKKYLFMECIPKPKKMYERHLFSIMRRCGKSMIEEVSDARAEQREYQEYIESWVHEIKAPITTTRLLLNNYKWEKSKEVLTQLVRMEEHVERVLYYARAGSVEKDFVIQETQLSDVVREVVSKYQQLLIQNNVRIETLGLDETVYTDGKWVDFMIGQLLSNAVRYGGENPVIQIQAQKERDKVQLDIIDNGIGISKHDLPRVFDRGFTGTNGRKRGGSTGMGLYLCKKLAASLQIEVAAKSMENAYTQISLILPGKESLSKM